MFVCITKKSVTSKGAMVHWDTEKITTKFVFRLMMILLKIKRLSIKSLLMVCQSHVLGAISFVCLGRQNVLQKDIWF